MNPYFDKKAVEAMIQASQGELAHELLKCIRSQFDTGDNLLELGMGPGREFSELTGSFHVTGSDISPQFTDRYTRLYPRSRTLVIDAGHFNISRTFDGIYSNKVLHHLDEEQLSSSLACQSRALRPGGKVIHSFWKGSEKISSGGVRFYKYEEEELKSIFLKQMKLMDCYSYAEHLGADMIMVIAQKIT